MTENTSVTEIERAAATLLSKTIVWDPAVESWIERLLADPNLIEYCPEGHHPNSASYEMKFDWNDPSLGDKLPRRQARLICQAVCNLGYSLAAYRDDGRPTGDVMRSISSGLAVTTSLAAAVVEFHLAILNAAYLE
jgi:hypothetical protein